MESDGSGVTCGEKTVGSTSEGILETSVVITTKGCIGIVGGTEGVIDGKIVDAEEGSIRACGGMIVGFNDVDCDGTTEVIGIHFMGCVHCNGIKLDGCLVVGINVFLYFSY